MPNSQQAEPVSWTFALLALLQASTYEGDWLQDLQVPFLASEAKFHVSPACHAMNCIRMVKASRGGAMALSSQVPSKMAGLQPMSACSMPMVSRFFTSSQVVKPWQGNNAYVPQFELAGCRYATVYSCTTQTRNLEWL